MQTIVVIDANAEDREAIVDCLQELGHNLSATGSAEAGRRRAAELQPSLVCMDLSLPDSDGMELLADLVTELPDVPVVVLATAAGVSTAICAMKTGAFDFLEKPLDSDALRTSVERALEQGRLKKPRVATAVATAASEKISFGAPAMRPVVDALRKVAPTDATVLLTGESGTGKDVAARAVHRWSERRQGPFVTVNCAALPENLLESELFGHEKGAFTSATARQRGRIEMAAGGTFFLDEVGELKPELQAKLLRVLEDRRFQRLGGHQEIEVDVRWIAASNRSLTRMVREGGFRADLYHRLAVFPIKIPPLRSRQEDIIPLSETLLARIARDQNRASPPTLTDTARNYLATYHWPGNIRELKNSLERACILADTDELSIEHFAPDGLANPTPIGLVSLDEIEKQAIVQALAATGGNRKRAAERLGIGLRTLYDKLKKYEIE